MRGFRYNARIVAEHLAERLGAWSRPRPRLERERVAPFLAGELARAPELWIQKGLLARIVTLAEDGSAVDEGVRPLEHFVDEVGPDGAAVAVEMDAEGRIFPAVYLRRAGRIREAVLGSHPVHAFDAPEYVRDLEAILRA